MDDPCLSDKLSEAKALIAKLTAYGDARFSLFGARDHRFAVQPAQDGGALAELEAFYGCAMPQSFRLFVEAVSDGGIGPYYGFHSTQKMARMLNEEAWALRNTVSWLEEDIDIGAGLARAAGVSGSDAVWSSDVMQALYAERGEAYLGELVDRGLFNGTVPLCNYGCGDAYMMTINGPRPGTIWCDSTDSVSGVFCLHVDIFEFFNAWARDSLAKLAKDDFSPNNVAWSILEYGRSPIFISANRQQ